MNNLFVLHTQYNLVLACGLCKTDFKSDNNELILFHDFSLQEELKKKLKKLFTRILILDGTYPPHNFSTREKMNKISGDKQKIKSFLDKSYERVFVVDDVCIQEMNVLKMTHQMNPSVEMSWLEDGTNAYFSDGVLSTGSDRTSVGRLLRRLFFSIFGGLGRYYDLGPCFGAHKLLRTIYLTFPNLVRAELRGKERREISLQSMEEGMKILYEGEPYPFADRGVIIVLDKLDRYGDNYARVEVLIAQEIEQARREGRKIYYKYHPRETGEMCVLQQEKQLDRTIAIENYLINSTVRTLKIVGVRSTSLQVAKKMGYDAISLIEQVEGKEVPISQFYRKIGVECR